MSLWFLYGNFGTKLGEKCRFFPENCLRFSYFLLYKIAIFLRFNRFSLNCALWDPAWHQEDIIWQIHRIIKISSSSLHSKDKYSYGTACVFSLISDPTNIHSTLSDPQQPSLLGVTTIQCYWCCYVAESPLALSGCLWDGGSQLSQKLWQFFSPTCSVWRDGPLLIRAPVRE